MNILVINGSPSGENSITLQTMLYIEKLFPGHTYRQINAASFDPSREALAAADMIVFCYPV